MSEELSKAIEWLVRYVAARDHSETELRTKLRRRFDAKTVEQSLTWAKDRQWLVAPDALAERATRELHGRRKSHRYIQGHLRRRGLPATPCDNEAELIKIRSLLREKFGSWKKPAYEEKISAMRYLRYRGFDDTLICQIFTEMRTE